MYSLTAGDEDVFQDILESWRKGWGVKAENHGDLQQSAGKMGRSTKEIQWGHESFSKTMIHQDNSWISTVFGDRATARGVVHAVAF